MWSQAQHSAPFSAVEEISKDDDDDHNPQSGVRESPLPTVIDYPVWLLGE